MIGRTWGKRVLIMTMAAMSLGFQGPLFAYMTQGETKLDDLLVRAERVFIGTVREQSVDIDECNAVVTYTTFQVIEPIKGTQSGESVLIKQVGSPSADSPLAEGQIAAPLLGPHMVLGQSYLIFLGREGEPCGYNNPLGLDRGLFKVEHDKNGNKILINGINNQLLFPQEGAAIEARSRTLDATSRALLGHREGAVSYDLMIHFLQQSLGGGGR